MSSTSAETVPRNPEILRVATASFIGTAIEWYDFFIYSTAAALVFGELFFPSDDPLTGNLLAFATLGIGFLARPFGSIVAGHFGDKVGRKAMLVLTLSVMGGSTVAVGLLPTHAQIGVWAPILLVTLRLLQGLSAGGEWGGAALMAVEHAPPGRRGLWGSLPQMGAPMGLILANLVFLITGSMTSDAQFLSWGWRIPFLVSIVLVGVGFYIRMSVSESPVFQEVKKTHAEEKVPLIAMLKKHPKQFVLATLSFIGTNAIGYILIAFLLSYGTTNLKVARSTMLAVALLGAVIWLIASPLAGAWSDRSGRRRPYLVGYALMAVWSVPFWYLINTTSFPLMLLAVVVLAIGLGLAYGPQSALFAELFDPELRYTGAGFAYAIGAVLGGGFAPLIATALVGATGTIYSVAIYMAAVAIISFLAILAIRESYLQRERQHDAEEVADLYASGSFEHHAPVTEYKSP